MSVVRMLAVTLVGRSADAEALMSAVQRAGLLHVQHLREPSAIAEIAGRADEDDPVATVERLERVRAAIAAVPESEPDNTVRTLDELVEHVLDLIRLRAEAAERLAAAEATIDALEPFGDFDPIDLDTLAARGIPVTFARLTWNDWRGMDFADVPYAIASQTELDVSLALFGPEAAALPLTPLRLPRVRLADARAEAAALQSLQLELDRRLGAQQIHIAAIDARRDALADRVAVLRTLDGGISDGPLFAVRGFIPARHQVDLQRAVADFAVVLQVDDPKAGEDVPVKLHQPPLLSGFAAVVRAFSGVSYWEKDFTPSVALLFLVYGSLCLLDGGYGVLLLATGLWLRRRGSLDFGNVFAVTGLFSIVVGMLGGQYFGLVVGTKGFFEGHAPPTPLAADPMACFIFSLIVGIAGMTFAYATAIWQRGWRTVATGNLFIAFGAIALVLAHFAPHALASLLVRQPSAVAVAETGLALALAGKVFIGGGIVSWLIWPDRVFGDAHVANVAWTLYSGITGFGQDVMSHMRLFGIALSGSIMALVVNKIAGLFPLPVTIAFAVFGHVFVYLLSLLSLYIHTNRLIFLEFGSKCIDGGQSWYEPMRSHGASNNAV